MGYLKIKSPSEKPIKIFDVDWHNTLEELNKRIKVNRERYMTDGFCSPANKEGILENSVKPNTIRITACPNGFYHNGNYANIYSNDDKDLAASMSNGVYYVYLQAQEVERHFEIPEDPFSNSHKYSSFKPGVKLLPVSDNYNHDPNDGIYIGQVHIDNGIARVTENKSGRKISKLRSEALPDIGGKFSNMFSLGIDGKIVLNTQLYKLMDIGIIEKADDSLYINTKHEDESKNKYNIVTINNTPSKFPGGNVYLNQDGLKGRIANIDIEFFKNNKALIFAIDYNNEQAYGIYPKPRDKITDIQLNTDNNSVVELANSNLMNPLGVFRIYNSKGESEIKHGLARNKASITLAGKVNSKFNNYNKEEIMIEQIGNFGLYNPDNGQELYKGIKDTYNYAFIGYYGEVDSDGKFSFVGKYSFDNIFETDGLGKITIRDQAVTTDKINDQAVTTDKINDQAVTTDKINDQAVTTDKINDQAVTEGKIANDAITVHKIANNSISRYKMQKDSITKDKIENGAVTEGKIANNSISRYKMQKDSITKDKIEDKTITADKIKDNTITKLNIGPNAVGNNEIINKAVTTSKIDDKAITTAKLNDKAVTTDKIANSAVTYRTIAANSVDTGEIRDKAITPPKLNYQYAKIWHQENSGVNGGTATAGWNTRKLTKIETTIPNVKLKNNNFTLPAGMYKILAIVPAFGVREHKVYLYKDNRSFYPGSTEVTGDIRNRSASATSSFIIGVFTIDKKSSFDIRHYVANSYPTSAFGHAVGISGKSEIYVQVLIEKVG